MIGIKGHGSKIGKPEIVRVFLLMSVVWLSACSALRHEEPQPRSGVVPGDTITVQGNKNVYAIAQEHGVSMRDIITLNALRPPFKLQSGQSLVLPFKRDGSSGGMASPMPIDGMAPAPFGGVQSQPLSPVIESQPLAPLSPTPASSSRAVTSEQQHVLGQTRASQSLDGPVNPPPKQLATTLAPLPSSSSDEDTSSSHDGAPAMAWPLKGPVLSGFGPKGNGVNNDGVNIGAPKGAPVVAAAGGIVVYAGNEMKGFGNLVLIRHEGGWVTAYAHLDRVLVTKDAVVAQGDMIGTVGKTGNISSPQLHFETRHNGKVVDPNDVVKAS